MPVNRLQELSTTTSPMELVMPELEDIKPIDLSNTKLYHVILDTDMSLLDNLSIRDGGFYGATRKDTSDVLPVVLDLDMAKSVATKLFKVATNIGSISIDGNTVYPVIGAIIIELQASSNNTTVIDLGASVTKNDLNKPLTNLTLYTRRGIISRDGLINFKINALQLMRINHDVSNKEISNHEAMIFYNLNPKLTGTQKRLLKQLLDNVNTFVNVSNPMKTELSDNLNNAVSVSNQMLLEQVGSGLTDPYERKYKKYKALYKRIEKCNMKF
jgi:hypothetical protein